MVAVNEPLSSTPSRLNVLKPCSENVTVYVPGRRSSTRVLARAVRDRGADLFDQRGTGGFDADTWKHGSGRILHRTGDHGLGGGGIREKNHPRNEDQSRSGTRASSTSSGKCVVKCRCTLQPSPGRVKQQSRRMCPVSTEGAPGSIFLVSAATGRRRRRHRSIHRAPVGLPGCAVSSR